MPCLCIASTLSRSFVRSFVSHSEEDVNCLALGPNQYEWPPKRRGREGKRGADNIDSGDDNEQSESELPRTMLQVMAPAATTTTGGSDGGKETVESVEGKRPVQCQTCSQLHLALPIAMASRLPPARSAPRVRSSASSHRNSNSILRGEEEASEAFCFSSRMPCPLSALLCYGRCTYISCTVCTCSLAELS